MTVRMKVEKVPTFKGLDRQGRRILKNIINEGANRVRNEAVQSIQAHGSSGVTYQKYNPRRTHTASAPKNPPNSDTGYLANNITPVFDLDGLGATIESRADYSVYLEFGTSQMRERPFLQPALEAVRPWLKRNYKRLAKLGG